LAVVLVLVGAAAGCGGSAAGGGPVVFGITGGNVMPYRVTVQPNGRVRRTGSSPALRRRIAPARVRKLRHDTRAARLTSRRCVGVLPDVAARYVRAGGRTFTVHGGCEPRFERVWRELMQAVAVLR
jgi:hypothetical protein